MKCPRCGGDLYGSVCPNCGNVVVLSDRTNRKTTGSSSGFSNMRRNSGNDTIKFMDNNGAKKVTPNRKKPKGNRRNLIFLIIIAVLFVLCIVFFAMYRSSASKYTEAQSQITSLNETIKANEDEIAKLKEAATQATTAATTDSGDGSGDSSSDSSSDDSTPVVEFDENGNLVNVKEGSSSSSNDSADDTTEYKSGDTYVIKDGDTGSMICNRIYGEYTEELWDKLLKANGMTTSSQYHPGDELTIP